MITPEALRKYCRQLPEEQAKIHADALEKARQSSSVNTPRRLVHIMGQMFVECGAFARLEESFKYKPDRLDALFKNVKGVEHARALLAKGDEAVGNCVYAKRNGNGDEASGDGFKYRGSGYLQLTGKENYRKFGEIASEDLVTKPELARSPDTAARIAFAYWDAKGLSKLADAGDLEGITKRSTAPPCSRSTNVARPYSKPSTSGAHDPSSLRVTAPARHRGRGSADRARTPCQGSRPRRVRSRRLGPRTAGNS